MSICHSGTIITKSLMSTLETRWLFKQISSCLYDTSLKRHSVRGIGKGKRTNTYKKPEGLTYISSEPLIPTTEGLIYTIVQNHYCIQIARTTITYNRRTNIHKKVVQNHYYLQPEGLSSTRKKHHMYRTTIVYQ